MYGVSKINIEPSLMMISVQDAEFKGNTMARYLQIFEIAGGDEQNFDACHRQSIQGAGCDAAAGDHLLTEEIQLGVAHTDEGRSLGVLV